MKKLLGRDESVVAIVIICLCLLIGVLNPAFFGVSTLVTTSRAMLVTLIFAMCEMLCIINGGVDISFPAVASFAMYATTKILIATQIDSVLVAYLIAAVLGLIMGTINAVLVGYFRIPSMIATLGTSSLFSGALLTFVGVNEITNIPKSLDALSKATLFSFQTSTGAKSSMSILILIPIILSIGIWLMLKYTMLGRSIYAVGGDPVSAQRAGFNVMKTRFFVFMFVGVVAAIGGVTYTILMRNSNPTNLMGGEMMVIAAVVIGGTRITGGHGGVFGTVLGVVLITLVSNNLIMIGIPNYWQMFFIGVLIVAGTTITSLRAKRVSAGPRI